MGNGQSAIEQKVYDCEQKREAIQADLDEAEKTRAQLVQRHQTMVFALRENFHGTNSRLQRDLNDCEDRRERCRDLRRDCARKDDEIRRLKDEVARLSKKK